MNAVKAWVKRGLASGPGWRLAAPLRRRGVAILMYHRVTRPGDPFPGTSLDDFAAQMRWLRERCEPLPVEALEDGAKLPASGRPPVVVTFDDGYRDFHDNAYPVLESLRIPAVVFLATSFMDSTRLIWTDAVTWAFHATQRDAVAFPWAPEERHALGSREARRAAERAAKGYLKNIDDEARQRAQEALFEALGVEPGRGDAGRQMLSWEEINATHAYATYGGHTHTHPILSRIPAEQVDREIATCRDLIAAKTGRVPRTFAYPNGRAADFTPQTRDCLRRHGFTLAFSTIEGLHVPGDDPFAIRRQPTGGSTLGDFAWIVAGRGA